jgi:hypothetical protein
MVDPDYQPGPDTPAGATPGSVVPGAAVPDTSTEVVETVSVTGVDVTVTGTTRVGTPSGRGGEVKAVRVDADAADFDFNVERDGSDVFVNEQSPSGTSEEEFFPTDDENASFAGEDPQIDFDVSTTSATTGATADVEVDVGFEEQEE